MNIKMPDEVLYIINTLETNGYEAYAVGGCIRDSLLGKEPKDWDICAPSPPEQTKKNFKDKHIIETGLKHGTITLMLNHKPFEITTYRADGIYTDNRRPDSVEFVKNLKEDLSRRDFTINAMAYNPKTGLMDFFGGVKDLDNKIIKCVGNADKRFREDALRIMRALRFASVFGFSIDAETSESIFANKNLLQNIASERIAAELNKLLIGQNAGKILYNYTNVITEIIPEIKNHEFNNFNDLQNVPADIILRLTMLLHKVDANTAKKILRRLKYDNETTESVVKLILYCDCEIQSERKQIKRWLNKLGEKKFRQLLEIKKALKNSDITGDIKIILNNIIGENQCYLLKDLAVNGGDLIDAGITEGVEIGKILKQLLDMVIEEQVDNDKIELLKMIEKIKKRRALNK